MKRHATLRALSRDHHHALTLARALAIDTPATLRAGLPDGAADAAAWVRQKWDESLRPHFLLEERELVPLGLDGPPELRTLTQQILDEHACMRADFEQLDADTFESRRDDLGRLLLAHVRFEERQWFPALEGHLSESQLGALGHRLQLEPESVTTGFHRDDEGVWIAELDCGHTRHVRHKPPFQMAEWVESEAGRVAMLGTRVSCPLCRMPRRPTRAAAYKQTPEYDAGTVPAGLLRSHRLKAGTWGEIHVLAGRVQYVLEDEHDLTVTLRPGVPGIVAPNRPHHIRPSSDARLRVQFMRCPEE